jgi:hypothetical protein
VVVGKDKVDHHWFIVINHYLLFVMVDIISKEVKSSATGCHIGKP